MGNLGVADITVTQLRRVSVSGGDVLHILKESDLEFMGFGEAYFSLVEFNAVKAWKRHIRMTLNLAMPVGRAKFVFIDDGGAIREEVIGENRYARLTVPPGIWFGFQGIYSPTSLLLNIADIPHDPKEVERRELSEFAYNWEM